MYKPHTNSDRRRYVEEVDLEAPIHFWVENPSECGIPLSDALHSRVKRLLKRDETVFEGRGPSVSIRLEVFASSLRWNTGLMSVPPPSGLAIASGVDKFLPKTSAALRAPSPGPSWQKMSQNVYNALFRRVILGFPLVSSCLTVLAYFRKGKATLSRTKPITDGESAQALTISNWKTSS